MFFIHSLIDNSWQQYSSKPLAEVAKYVAENEFQYKDRVEIVELTAQEAIDRGLDFEELES